MVDMREGYDLGSSYKRYNLSGIDLRDVIYLIHSFSWCSEECDPGSRYK